MASLRLLYRKFCLLLGLHPTSVLPVQTINSVLTGGGEMIIPGPHCGTVPESLEAEFAIIRKGDGAARWIARRGEIVREGSGFRLIGVIFDITTAKLQEAALRELNETLESRVEQVLAERQQAEEALRQAQKMEAVGQLTGGIAHDFNNLLMAITSSLSLLQKRLPADPDITRLIDNAAQGAQRGAALTQRMLAFARRQDLKAEQIDVAELVAGMRDLVERTLGPSWSLSLDFAEPLPAVLADANQLEMALLNLAVNARDAMPDGGPIKVSARLRTAGADESGWLASGAYIALSVIDTGLGMDADILARAAEPFFTTKGVGKGTGLGLSMIHGLAKQLNGGFTLDSAPGCGTTATLWLPLAPEGHCAPPLPTLHEAKEPVVGRLKVLAVDDDGLILMNTAAMLEDLGHDVLEACSGEQALAHLTAHPDVDLLITDQSMPGMTGTQLADRASAIVANLPIILASGYAEVPAGAKQRIIKLGKPFGQAMLEKAIAEALAAKRH